MNHYDTKLTLTPEQYGIRAQELFLSGYNCSQAVACAFADLVPVDEQTLLLSAAAFGGGMGRLREVCGCLSGCYIILGLLSAGKVPSDQAAKKLLYQRIQAFAGIYKERHGSYICRELLKLGTGASDPNPAERTAEYYKKRPCPQLARDTAEQFARFLESEGIV